MLPKGVHQDGFAHALAVLPGAFGRPHDAVNINA
jgi:hypothetical protein